ncbi:MAG: hypothetical protein BXU00_01475 [Candidatus Nanoclepta minutus]|uniref:Phosphoribosyltransferase domain-containing protein n=1 Tax=Candidatus Nanoclepta minutus TaxID=1940235 RepID=A0A397WPI8_9ARCH|nr:MAG: hypothetical protein BXU00_01475 [Candidatus Nanoclepta minutus]
MVVDKKPILSFPYGRIVVVPDTPIDLTEGTIGDIYHIFSRNLKDGKVHYTEKTHSSLERIAEEVWNKPILKYQEVKQLPNPYKSLDEVLKNIDGKKAIVGIGRSSLPYLIHTLMHYENLGESGNVYIYVPTKWEKSGRQIQSSRIPVVYATIEKLVRKHKPEKIVIIDDVMATGYTFRNIYHSLEGILKDLEIYLVPVSLDMSIILISNLSNSGRHLPIDSILYNFFTKEMPYFEYGLEKGEWRNILENFSKVAGKRYNRKDLEELSKVLSHTYPAIVINSSGGETYPVTHLIRDAEEEVAKKIYYSTEITDLMDLQAKYFQNPLLELLNKYKERIYHAPRTL